jgi:hypothetical protein
MAQNLCRRREDRSQNYKKERGTLVKQLQLQKKQDRYKNMYETEHRTDGSAKYDNDDDTNLFYLLPPWVPWPFFSAAFCLLLFFLGSSFMKQQSKQIDITNKHINNKETARKYPSSRQQRSTSRPGSSKYLSSTKQQRTF